MERCARDIHTYSRLVQFIWQRTNVPVPNGGTGVPFTIGWRCHFRTIARDSLSVPSLFYALACSVQLRMDSGTLAHVYNIPFFSFVYARYSPLSFNRTRVERWPAGDPFIHAIIRFLLRIRGTKYRIGGNTRKDKCRTVNCNWRYTSRRNTRKVRKIFSTERCTRLV